MTKEITGGTGTSTIENPDPGQNDTTAVNPLEPNADAVDYFTQTDPIADEGQFFYPGLDRLPKVYWTIPGICNSPSRNDLGKAAQSTDGLQYHLLCQSLAGVVNKAFKEGRTEVAVWLEKSGAAYSAAKTQLGKECGMQTAYELLSRDYGTVEGYDVDIKSLIEGYVLTDVEHNPESAVAAAMAAHVYNSVIVDKRDEEYFKSLGYALKYDASGKSTADGWADFKNDCSKSGLVIMPVQTAEIREYAITNSMAVVNLNKVNGNASGGQNGSVLNDMLSWLNPDSPVMGWESGVGEDQFVSKVSRYGHLMLASDWSYNHSLTSAAYRERQSTALAQVQNPRSYDYDTQYNYVSFFLTDGDNYQWVMGDGFLNSFFNSPYKERVHMGYGLCSESLSQLCPDRFSQIYAVQAPDNTVMECFGGGYFYIDNYGSSSTLGRSAHLENLAKRTAAHMRQHRLKVLHLVANDWDSEAAKAGYQALIDANDQLEGITVIQYSPYNGGHGDIIWLKNKAGYDIPVVSARYSLWQGGNNGQGNPAEIAAEMKATGETNGFSLIDVHAWSTFNYRTGAGAADLLMQQLPDGYRAVSVQEFIWRLRMSNRKEQTILYLKTIK